MFAVCSEISIKVIVKHVQHVGIIWTCSLPGADLLSFLVPWATEKIAGFWFARGISTQADTMSNVTILTSLKSKNFLFQPW